MKWKENEKNITRVTAGPDHQNVWGAWGEDEGFLN